MFKYYFLVLVLSLAACASGSPGKAQITTAATVCEEPRPEVCTMDYRSVCAGLANGGQKTYSNGCSACADVSVMSWIEGSCPD
jgi:cytochrome c5